MTVHRRDCPRIAGLDDVMAIKWRIEPTLTTLARIDLRALDEIGLMGAVVAAGLCPPSARRAAARARAGPPRLGTYRDSTCRPTSRPLCRRLSSRCGGCRTL